MSACDWDEPHSAVLQDPADGDQTEVAGWTLITAFVLSGGLLCLLLRR
jgi:hypothetical protein